MYLVFPFMSGTAPPTRLAQILAASSPAIISPGHPTHLLREKFSRAGGLPSTFVHPFDLPIQKPSPTALEADRFSFHTLAQIKTSTSHSTFYWSLFITFSLDGVVVSLLRYLSRRVEDSQTILFPGDEGFRMHIVALCVFMAGEELGVAG